MDSSGAAAAEKYRENGVVLLSGKCYSKHSFKFHEPRKEKQSMLRNVYTIVMAMPQMMMGRINCI